MSKTINVQERYRDRKYYENSGDGNYSYKYQSEFFGKTTDDIPEGPNLDRLYVDTTQRAFLQILSAFEWVDVSESSAATPTLRFTGNFLATGDIQAFTDAGIPGSIWDDLPIATASVLGAVKIGSGVSVTPEGVISVDTGAGMVYPSAGIAVSNGDSWGTSLQSSGIGESVLTTSNPSAIRFLLANADNSISWLDAYDFREAIGVTRLDDLSDTYIPFYNASSDSLEDSSIYVSGTTGLAMEVDSVLIGDGSILTPYITVQKHVAGDSGIKFQSVGAGGGLDWTLQHNSNNDLKLIGNYADRDFYITLNDGGVSTNFAKFEASTSKVFLPPGIKMGIGTNSANWGLLQLGDGITSQSTTLAINSTTSLPSQISFLRGSDAKWELYSGGTNSSMTLLGYEDEYGSRQFNIRIYKDSVLNDIAVFDGDAEEVRFPVQVNLETIDHVSTDTDKFLVGDSGIVKYRTGAELASDIGALTSVPTLQQVTDMGATTTVKPDFGGGIDVQYGIYGYGASNFTINSAYSINFKVDDADIISGSSYNFYLDNSLRAELTKSGLVLNFLSHETTDVDSFLVSNNGLIKYRTGSELLSDIGGASASLFVPYTGATTNLNLGSYGISAASADFANLTTGYIPYDNGTNLVDSLLYTDGTYVGIGTTNPFYDLHIGDITATDTYTLHIGDSTTAIRFGNEDSGDNRPYVWARGGSVPLTFKAGTSNNGDYLFTSTGNVGIGTTGPTEKLDVLDGSFALTNSDVSHGVTTLLSANQYFKARIMSGTNGGTYLLGASDADSSAFQIEGIIGVNNPTDTTPAVIFTGSKYNGVTGTSDLGALETAFQFRNRNTNLVTVLGDGNVGIGTSSPLYKLDVQGTGYFSSTLYLGTQPNDASSVDQVLRWNSTNKEITSSSIDELIGDIGYWDRDTVNGYIYPATLTDKVGIGTTSPSQKLSIEEGSLRVYNTGGSQLLHQMVYNSDGSQSQIKSLSDDTGIQFNIYDGVDFVNNVLVLKEGGNVGIGTTSPTVKLEVDGNGYFTSMLGVGKAPTKSLSVYVDNALTTPQVTIEQDGAGDTGIQFSLTSTKNWVMGIDNSDSDKFKIENGNIIGGSNDFVIDGNGNVGIGTSSPLYKLHTVGTGYFSSTLTVNSLVKIGGTSSQFLKADGSVDSNTYLTGNQNITLSGDVTGSGTTSLTTTISSSSVEYSMLNNNIISGQSEVTTGLLDTDELLLSYSGVLKRIDLSVLKSYFDTDLNYYVNSIAFDTNTGILTLGRSGLADLTQDLDGRYLTGTKVDSFNTRTGAVTLSKTDVEGVLTGLITSHTHNYTNNTGTVTSVAMSTPTGFSISGSPITTFGTLALSFASGYSLPTDIKQGQWDTAYNHSQVTTGNPHSISVSDLGDVALTSLATNDILKWNGTNWVNVTDETGSNYYLTGVSGSGNGIVTFTVSGASNPTWDSSHNHNDIYYTETEIGNFFSGASSITGYNKSNWDSAYGWGDWSSGVDKSFIDALNVDSDTLDGQHGSYYLDYNNFTNTPTSYSLPLAANGTRGGVQIGYTENGKNYPIELSSEMMFVNVPWTDTVYTHPNHTGHVTSTGDGATVLTVSAITGQTVLTSGLISTDELLISDGGVIKRMDVSVLQTYQQANLLHDSFSDFVTNEHIDHSTVTLTAGTGLTGGGTIASNRTFNVDVGIADNKIVQIDSASVTDNDYAKFTASGLEGRSYSEMKSDLSLNLVENTALSTWTGSTYINTLGTITTGTWNGSALGANYVPNHDSLNGFVANEHIDWTSTSANLLTTGSGTFGGRLLSNSTTDATTTLDGSIQTDGGLSVVKSVYVGANIYAVGEIEAYDTSDIALKQHMKPIKDALQTIQAWEMYSFNWNLEAIRLNPHKDEHRRQYGAIAQDVLKINPELVHAIHNDYLSLDYRQMIPILATGIKELHIEVKSEVGLLKERISVLENKIKDLENLN